MKTLLALLVCAPLLVAQPRPKVTGVAHIAIFAHDIQASRAFYTGVLGYEEAFDLKQPDGSLSLTFFKINERQYIELFPEKAPSTDRLNHIALEVENAEAMRGWLAAHGVAVPPKVSKGRTGNSNFMIKDPDGINVEIVQYEPDSASARARGKSLGPNRLSDDMAHVGILVGNLEKSLAFYNGILGFHETWRGSRDPKVLNWVNLQAPDSPNYIELMLYEAPIPEPTARGTAHHLCLFVPDIEKSKAALATRPYTKPLEIRTGINRRRQLNLYDPDGTRVELMEPRTIDGQPAPSSQAPAPGVH